MKKARKPPPSLILWESGWQVFLGALGSLQPQDLLRELTIRGETHTVLGATQRQVAHYSGHYQLILLTKTLRGADFETLSIARGDSAAFNKRSNSAQTNAAASPIRQPRALTLACALA